jgi:hypothetical protein
VYIDWINLAQDEVQRCSSTRLTYRVVDNEQTVPIERAGIVVKV